MSILGKLSNFHKFHMLLRCENLQRVYTIIRKKLFATYKNLLSIQEIFVVTAQ